jgi:hypothetical protein
MDAGKNYGWKQLHEFELEGKILAELRDLRCISKI